MRPDWDFSPMRMRTMHHLPQILFDTLRPERPDCPVLVPSNFSVSRDKVIAQDIYSYEPCGLPTGNFMPAEKAQIRLMTASPISLGACTPAPDQVTPERAYFKDLDFYKKTLFHTPFLSRGRAVTLLEYRDAKIVFEVDDWFNQLPQAVQRYLLPLQSMYTSGMIKTCATSLRTNLTAHCVRLNKPTFSAITCSHANPAIDIGHDTQLCREKWTRSTTSTWTRAYPNDEPPVVQWLAEAPRHSTPRADPNTPSARPRPAVELPRPQASSAPPSSHPAKRMALHYLPVTEEITPPIAPPHAQTTEMNTATETVPETPSPVQKPGRSRGRGTWRAPQNVAPGVGTRSKTRLAEIEKREVTQAKAQAQAAHARWPPSPDTTENIQRLTRELKLCDVPRDAHKELQRVLPSVEEEQIRTSRQPPVAGLMTQHPDVYYIPPPRVVGGARGNSAPVSTATLGLIHRQDPSLAAQLREDPGSMMTQATRRRVYSTMRLIRTGMLGQLASLQQWEEAMHRQYDV